MPWIDSYSSTSASGLARALGVRAAAFDRLGASVAVLDGSGVILDTNESWRLFAHLNEGTAVTTGPGVNYLEVCDRSAAAGADGAAAVAAGLRRILSGDSDRLELEYLCESPTEDSWFLLQASAAPVADGAGLVIFHVDVTARKVMADRLGALTDDDALTGLSNRRSAVLHLDEQLALARTSDVPVWVLLLDLDDVAAVNEQYGRHVGDELLVKVAIRTRRAVRITDRLCRFGGNEFLVVCPGLGREGAAVLAGRLRDVLSEPFQVAGLKVVVGVSVGFARSRRDSTVDTLVGAAGVGMHRNKRRVTRERAADGDSPSASGLYSGTSPGSASDRTARGSPGTGDADPLIAELAAAAARFDAGSVHSSDLLLFLEVDGTIHSATAAALHLFGVEPERLIGLSGLDLIHPDDQERVFLDFASIPNAGDSICTLFRILHPGGRTLWVEATATNLVEDPDVGFIVANIGDITDRVLAEESVRFQARLLAAVGQAVIATDMEQKVIYWNPAAETTYGWTADEAIGRHLGAVLRIDARSTSLLDDFVRRLSEGQPWSGELWIHAKASGPIPVLLTDTPVYDDAGLRIGTIGVSVDISERLRSEEAKALLSAIVEASQDAIFSATTSDTITSWNEGASKLFGRSGSEMLGQRLSVVLPNDCRPGDEQDPGAQQVYLAALEGLTVQAIDTRGRRADGSDVLVSIAVSPIRSAAGVVIGTCTIARDVSERVELMRTIEADRRSLAEAQASAKLGSFELNIDTGEVTRSAELCRILGLEPDDTTGTSFETIHPEDRDFVVALVGEASTGRDDGDATYRIVRPHGEIRWVHSQARKLPAPRSHMIAGTMLDITERHDAEVTLAHQATHDWLTQLPNMGSLHDSLTSALVEFDPLRLVAVAVIDIDHFKQVNNGSGHTHGNRTLRAVADRLRTRLRPTDVVARVAGDEFVVVRSIMSTLDDARQLGAEGVALMREPLRVGDRDLQLTASVGVTLNTADDSAVSLLRDAEDAMYEAKRDGRNRATVFDHNSRTRANRRQRIEAAMPYALEHGCFHLEFQPIIELASLEVAGFESLVRWEHPDLGTITPDEFIPVAESNGLILPLGEWVLAHSLRQLASWQSNTLFRSDLWMAINVSASQLVEPHLADHVASAMEKARVQPATVHLEITESVLMDRVDNAMRTIIELRATGACISIDDFGTGYSSLSYLSRLPVDTIKIDRSFVSGLGGTGHDTPIVAAMMALAGTLGLDVVAEGVERRRQVALLTELGCTYGQGFIWSRSMRPAAALEWMLARMPRHPSAVEAQIPFAI